MSTLTVPAIKGDSTHRGEFMVVIAALLFGLNGTVSKLILQAGLPAMRFTEIRCGGAFICLLTYALIRRPASLKINRKQIGFLALYGVAGFAGVQVFYFVAIARLPVGIGLLLEFTAPILITLYVRFVRKEDVKSRMWAALVLAICGLILVGQVWNGLTLNGIGLIAGGFASISLTIYYLLGEHGVGIRDTTSLTAWAFGFATAFWLIVQPLWDFPFHLLSNQVSLGGRFSNVQAPLSLFILFCVLFGTVAPFILVVSALRHTTPARTAMIGMLEPIFASVVAWWWIGESLTLLQILGGLVVLTGIGLAESAR
ncbi:MAG TPA: DMT family transporter [Candidatus Nanopelagicaceae bacterium]|nr:DMT family transporter [Candidatus Nanopelagicaceae bacterium]